MLEIKDLNASVDGVSIIKGMNLIVNPGEVHAVMGPNGSGKSTLSKIIAGHPDYQVTSGAIEYEINFKKKDLLAMEPEERAREGVFLAFQYPVEIPGVDNKIFLRTSFDTVCEHQGVERLSDEAFDSLLESKRKMLSMDKKYIERDVNVDFSGGEKKRNEILQMAILNPRLTVLDEIDSGLDIDSLKIVAEGVNKLRSKDNAFIVITHYQRLLDYIVPDVVHILHNGKIIKTGDKNLALEVEEKGYDWLLN